MSAGMDGTGRIADDLYLLAHDDRSGHLLLQPRTLGLGVAGALLAELIIGGVIRTDPNGMLAAGTGRPADELGRRVAGLVAGEQPLPVRDWLLYLARSAPHDVAGRLEQAGYLASAGQRLPWRAARLVPVDPEWAFAPLLRVGAALNARRHAGSGRC